MEKLYEELEKYARSDYYPFHMPGHKRNKSCVDSDFPFERDITEIYGFDNLHHPEGLIRSAQERLSRLYGTKESFFCVNGSTGALLSAISAAVPKNGQILVARNCHKAVYHGMYLRELNPTYLYPQTDPKLGINGGIFPSHVERCLRENGGIQGILITSPTYDGIVSDVESIAGLAHERGIPLIVDEAHGSHFRFSSYFPKSAAELGADVVIQSFHKTLPSLTQTSVLHLCSDRVDRERIKRFLGIYQTSSPSYILMASLDACVDRLARQGEEMFQRFARDLSWARERLSHCRHIRLVPTAGDEGAFPGRQERIKSQDSYFHGAFDFDRSKLILSAVNSSMGGARLSRILREKYHLEMEMETENYVIAMTTVGDTREGLERLCDAVCEIDREEEKRNLPMLRSTKEQDYDCGPKRQVLSIARAMDASVTRCPLEESVGRISAEFAYLYPPGIPLLVPGEEITGCFVRNVRRYMEQGLELQGLCDETNTVIQVVDEES